MTVSSIILAAAARATPRGVSSYDDTTPLFVSPAAAGRILGMSRSTVYRLLAAGVLQGRKVGTLCLIDVSAAKVAINNMQPAVINLPNEAARGRIRGVKVPAPVA